MNETTQFLDDLKAQRGTPFAGGVQVGSAMSALIILANNADESRLPLLREAIERTFMVTMTVYCETHDIDPREMREAIENALALGGVVVRRAGQEAVN